MAGVQSRRVVVISEAPLGSTRAHAINVIKTAGGFARCGHEVTLCCLPPEGEDAGVATRSLLERYGEADLRVELAPREILGPDDEPGARSRAVGRWAASHAACAGAEVVYARHFVGGLESRAAGLATVIETHAHAGDPNPTLIEAFRATRAGGSFAAAGSAMGGMRTTGGLKPLGIATISRVLREDYIARGADPERVFIVPDGVDVAMFARPEDARVFAPATLREPGPHAVYAGHLYDYKGIPAILAAAAIAPEIRWHLVGGTAEDIDRVEAAVAGLANVEVHGHIAHAEVPGWLWSADVLLLPPNADHPSARWTSPVKLGEYLASETPIVASDISALRDWVDERVVTWFRAPSGADPAGAALVEAVRAALEEAESGKLERGESRRARARELARQFSYANRAAAMVRIALDAAGESGAGRCRSISA